MLHLIPSAGPEIRILRPKRFLTVRELFRESNCMLTTDIALLRKMQADTRTRVDDPVDFIRENETGQDENGL